MPRLKTALKVLAPLPVAALAMGAANVPAQPGPVINDTHTTDAPEVAAVTTHDLVQAKTAWETADSNSGFTYTVRHGDTLSSIAKKLFGHAHYWPAVWRANERKIHNPNVLQIGTKLEIPGGPAKVTAKLTADAYSAIPKPPPAHHQAVLADSTTHSVAQSAPQAASGAADVAAVVNPSGYSGFQACVIRAESGGNSQITNATGHWGLYQFSYSTWVAHGGAPGDFGHASVEEQGRVFWNTVAADGTSDWSPYDSC